jgi:hypothetical protein
MHSIAQERALSADASTCACTLFSAKRDAWLDLMTGAKSHNAENVAKYHFPRPT